MCGACGNLIRGSPLPILCVSCATDGETREESNNRINSNSGRKVTGGDRNGGGDEDELAVGTMLLRSLQFLQFNAHEIAAWDNDEGKSVFLGGGLFLTLALFNHSCDPAIVR